jgi:hypothetical protein
MGDLECHRSDAVPSGETVTDGSVPNEGRMISNELGRALGVIKRRLI